MTAQLGTVIAGTLLPEALLVAFGDELERHIEDTRTDQQKSHTQLVWLTRELYPNGKVLWGDEEAATEQMQELMDALQEYAPDHAYFGTHPSDGADFGFWQNDDEFIIGYR